ncbi:MAG: carboxypeptidase regulatory-like domain-containing protein [Sandaracinaceae bacterium]|nr:carboxypeptidase regulatory-like domain-containing protein [Sandaracinaceae bacterium]
MRLSLLIALFAVLPVLSPTTAVAQARVIVEVRGAEGAADGLTVELSPADGGRSFRCTTSKGKCSIDGVPGGRYRAKIIREGEGGPRPRSVMIPPSGEVTVVLPAR